MSPLLTLTLRCRAFVCAQDVNGAAIQTTCHRGLQWAVRIVVFSFSALQWFYNCPTFVSSLIFFKLIFLSYFYFFSFVHSYIFSHIYLRNYFYSLFINFFHILSACHSFFLFCDHVLRTMKKKGKNQQTKKKMWRDEGMNLDVKKKTTPLWWKEHSVEKGVGAAELERWVGTCIL